MTNEDFYKAGGSAFPTGDHPESQLYASTGMTLRDYFAAKAMPYMLGVSVDEIAKTAYEIADAMLKARDK
jgi:hypothetical protein